MASASLIDAFPSLIRIIFLMNSREVADCARQLVEIVNHRIHNLRYLPVLIALPNRFHPTGLGTPNIGL